MFRSIFCCFLFIFLVMSILEGKITERKLYPHSFQFDPKDYGIEPIKVAVRGTFNGYSNAANPLKQGKDGVWRTEIAVEEGIYYYQFHFEFVDREGYSLPDQTHSDPFLEYTEEMAPGWFSKKSAFYAGSDWRKKERKSHFFHEAEHYEWLSPELVHLKLATVSTDVTSVYLIRFLDETLQTYEKTLLTNIGKDPFKREVYSTRMHGVPLPKELYYLFVIHDKEKDVFFGKGGETLSFTEAKKRVFHRLLEKNPTASDWVEQSVWYQIFPSMFRNGGQQNDSLMVYPWREQSSFFTWLKEYKQKAKAYSEMIISPELFSPKQTHLLGSWNQDCIGLIRGRQYGGNIQGIKEKLSYLKNLGVSVLYLNPLFLSYTTHKYHTVDLRHIDDEFGIQGSYYEIKGETDDPQTWKWTESDKVFLDFVEEAHRLGFRVIIDLVLHSMSKYAPFVQDVLEKKEESPYFSWFEIKENKKGEVLSFMTWDLDFGGGDLMPLFRIDSRGELNPGVKRYLFEVTKRWLAPDGNPNRGVDGFRLDSPSSLPFIFWEEWGEWAKSIKPDFFICGECWRVELSQESFRYGRFQGVTNMPFGDSLHALAIAKKKNFQPMQKLWNDVLKIGMKPFLRSINVIDNHDTPRLASMIMNPEQLWHQDLNREVIFQKTEGWNQELIKKMKQVVNLQMVLPGVPLVYYGDEAGMWSPIDPFNRSPMWWEDLEPFEDPRQYFSLPIFQIYQKAIALRNTFPVLQSGDCTILLADQSKGAFVFLRQLGKEKIYTFLNVSEKSQTISLPMAKESGNLINLLDENTTLMTSSNEKMRTTLNYQNAALVPFSGGVITVTLPKQGIVVLLEKEN